MTKDERFLIELYKAATNKNEPINPQKIAKNLGYKENLTKEILKGLRQANLIRIYDHEEVILTERGQQVANSLIS